MAFTKELESWTKVRVAKLKRCAYGAVAAELDNKLP